MKMEKADCQSLMANKMSSAQLRKIKKPVIEKRRRERINDSLNQLKTLVLDAMQKDESRYSKMEKADILEMTVHHLKNVHRRQKLITVQEDQGFTQQKYTSGFNECAKEVSQFLAGADGLSQEVKMRMMSHLSQTSSRMSQQQTQPQQPQQQQQQQPITPTPIIISPVYREPVSPQAMNAALPCATSVAALPGSPAAQYSPGSTTCISPSMSPISLVSTASVPMAFPSGVVLVSPTGSNHSSMSPASSPTHMNSAIPLYASGQKYSAVSPSYNGHHYEQSRHHSSSPVMGDDAPMQYSPEEVQRLRSTVIAKHHSGNSVSTCKSAARLAYHRDNMVAANPWRPW